jgi:hypothetical protein
VRIAQCQGSRGGRSVEEERAFVFVRSCERGGSIICVGLCTFRVCDPDLEWCGREWGVQGQED